MGIVSAGGKTYSILEVDRDGCMDGSWEESDVQPAGVSPSPWRKMRAALLLLLLLGEDVVVDIAVVD